MKVIAVANEKGGAGKTSTALALWAYMNANGRPCLGMDLDPQGNFSTVAEAETKGATALGVLMREIPAADAIQHVKSGDVIAASPLQNRADNLLTMLGKERRLAEALATVAGGYEYAIVDTSPHLGILTINALAAANYVLIPAQADMFSNQGITQLWETIEAVRQYAQNPTLQVDGILLTRFTDRTRISQTVRGIMEKTAANMGGRVYRSTIREAVTVKEAQLYHQSIFEYDPAAKVAGDYTEFCKEFLEGIES